MRILCECGASFMRSGIWNHQRLSHDPRCKEPIHMPTFELRGCDDDQGLGEENFPIGANDHDVDHWQTGEPEEDGYEEKDGESDDNEGDEPFLEPYRLPNPLITNSESNDTEPEVNDCETQRANRLRGGAEAELDNKPYVVKLSGGKAGAVYSDQEGVNGNTAYTSQIDNPDSPFSPFSSQIDWEIALWAKTRGPSSTAFTELMSIEGVSDISVLLYTFRISFNLQPRSTNVLASPSRTHQN
jgi:hypothetical protein